MLVRRPRRPVARLAERDAGHDAARLDVLADQHVEVALRGRAAGLEVQRRILLHVGEAHDLHGMTAARPARRSPRGRSRRAPGVTVIDAVARHIDRVVAPERDAGAVDLDRGAPRAGRPAPVSRSPVANATGASSGIEDDPAVVQVRRRGLARRHGRSSGPCGAAVFAHDAGRGAKRLSCHGRLLLRIRPRPARRTPARRPAPRRLAVADVRWRPPGAARFRRQPG